MQSICSNGIFIDCQTNRCIHERSKKTLVNKSIVEKTGFSKMCKKDNRELMGILINVHYPFYYIKETFHCEKKLFKI